MAESSDVESLEKFAREIRKAPEAAGRALVDVLNLGADRARELGVDRIAAELNLPRGYIDQRMQVTERPVIGDITARIGVKRRPILLTRYGGDTYMTEPAKSPRRKLKGNPARGIPRGRKAAGIAPFSVKRASAPQAWPGGFLIRLKNGNGYGLAVRTGPGRGDFEIKYGTSLAAAWSDAMGEVEQDVRDEMLRDFEKFFRRYYK